LEISVYLISNKNKMRNALNFNYFRLLILAGLTSWAVGASGQVKYLSVGGGIGYNTTPVFEFDDITWQQNNWNGNFTPAITLRYGNKVSGVFKASYIRNTFEQTIFSQYGGTSTDRFEADIHQIFCDLLFEHTPRGSKGFYYYLGTGFGIPVKVKLTEEYYRGAWGPYPPTHTYEESIVPAEFDLCIQAVIGLGGYIPIKEKNLVSLECNFRIGLNKVLVNVDDSEEARIVAIQFILGYLRRL
jgi:hypothetical protein